MSCSLGCRLGLDPTLLWLWHRLAATALIRPQAWKPPYTKGAALIQSLAQELPYTAGVAQEKKKKKTLGDIFPQCLFILLCTP